MIKQIVFNLFFALMIFSALLTFVTFPIIFIFYFLWSIILWFILRIYLCGSCEYYGKSCYTGWGMIAKYLTKKRKFSKYYVHLTNIYWIGLIFLPILTWIIDFVKNYQINNLFIALFFTSLTIIFIMHFNACKNCKNKPNCWRWKNENRSSRYGNPKRFKHHNR